MNIQSVSGCNFKGIYVSNALNPGTQRELGKEIKNFLVDSGICDKYEKNGKDFLITKHNDDGITLHVKPINWKRVLDDNYTRWNGKLY